MAERQASGVARALSGGVEEQSGNYTPKSILLTGGAGFIASHVVIRLCSRYPETKVSSVVSGFSGWAFLVFTEAGLNPVKPRSRRPAERSLCAMPSLDPDTRPL